MFRRCRCRQVDCCTDARGARVTEHAGNFNPCPGIFSDHGAQQPGELLLEYAGDLNPATGCNRSFRPPHRPSPSLYFLQEYVKVWRMDQFSGLNPHFFVFDFHLPVKLRVGLAPDFVFFHFRYGEMIPCSFDDFPFILQFRAAYRGNVEGEKFDSQT